MAHQNSTSKGALLEVDLGCVAEERMEEDEGNRTTNDVSSSSPPIRQSIATASGGLVVDTAFGNDEAYAYATPPHHHEYNENDTVVSQTPELLEKFQALSDQWSVATSSSRRWSSHRDHRETMSLVSKLEDLEQRWTHTNTTPRSTGSYDSSSLGQTTLSSRDGEQQLSVFERLYRNERKSHHRRRSTARSSQYSLERRRTYSERVRKVWKREQRTNGTPSSPSASVADKDSVFERLYRQTPRRRRSAVSSVRSAPTVVAPQRSSSRHRRSSPQKPRPPPKHRKTSSPASSTSPTSPMSGSDHPRTTEAILRSAQPIPTMATSPASPPRLSHRREDLTLDDNIPRSTTTTEPIRIAPRRETECQATPQAYRKREAAEPRDDTAQKLLQQAALANKARRLWIREQQTTTTAAVQIQKVIRGVQYRRRRSRAALVLQQFARNHILEKGSSTLVTTTRPRPSPRHPSSPEDTCARAVYRQAVWCAPHLQRLLSTYLSGRALLITTTHQKVTRLQALVRGSLVRARYHRLVNATVLIQHVWRSYRAARRLAAAWLVQRWWRMQWQRRRYARGRKACIVLQRTVRRQRAIVRLQSVVRRELAQRQALEQMRAVLLLQDWWRTRQDYDVDAIVRVQSVVRRWIVQRSIVDAWSAALTVQGWWRRQKVHILLQNETPVQRALVCWDELEPAVLVVQRHARHWLALRHEATYREHRSLAASLVQRVWKRKRTRQLSAVIRLQAWMRGHLAQSEYRQARYAVIRLQSTVRQHLAREDYRRARHSVIRLQTMVRQHTVHKEYTERIRGQRLLREASDRTEVLDPCSEQETLSEHHKAAQRIQATWRQNQCRRFFLIRRMSCTAIQRFVRRSLGARKLRAERRCTNASRRLQRWIRRYQTMHRYRAAIHAVVMLQKHTRGMCARRDVCQKQARIRTLQAHCRRFMAQQRLEQLQAANKAAKQLQRWWRVQRRELACVLLQSHTRALLARRRVLQQEQKRSSSAVLLQTWARRRQSIMGYRRSVRAIVLVQTWFRQQVARQLYVRWIASTVLLQRSFRRYTTWRRLTQMSRSARLIQSKWRSFSDYQLRNAAAVILQSHSRMVLCRDRMGRKQRSCVTIQAIVRRKMAMTIAEELRSVAEIREGKALIIQRWIRMREAQLSYKSVLEALTRIQAVARGCITKKRVARHAAVMQAERCTGAATLLQRYSRQRQAVQIFNRRKVATQVLQSSARCWLARQQTTHLRSILSQEREREQSCAIILQARSRGIQARIECARRRRSILFLQGFISSRICRREYLILLHAVKVAQRAFRSVHDKRRITHCNLQAKRIQQAWRSRHRNRLIFSARKIQAFLMMAHVCKLYHTKRRGCVAIQSAARQKLARDQRQRQLEELRRIHRSATVIQRRFRTYRDRAAFVVLRKATLHTQRITRGFVVRCHYKMQLLKIKQLQSRFRRFRAEVSMKRQCHAAVVEVQRWWRQRLSIVSAQKRQSSCRLIQSSVRLWLARQAGRRRRENVEHLRLQESGALIIQSLTRKHHALVVYRRKYDSIVCLQKSIRRLLVYRKYETVSKSVVRLQRWFRCCRLRRRFTSLRDGTKRVQHRWRKYHDDQRQDIAARTIQSLWKDRCQDLRNLVAVVKIQCAVRIRFAKNAHRRALVARNDIKVTRLQAWARMRAARNNYSSVLYATVRLQACARSFLSRSHFRRVIWLIVQVQLLFRRFMQHKRHARFNAALIEGRREASAAFLVRWWRFQLAAKRSNRQQTACLMLQAWARSCRAREELHNMQEKISSTVAVQSWWRLLKSRWSFATAKRSIVLLQSLIRCFIYKRNWKAKLNAASCIQVLWRRSLRNRMESSAASILQSQYRVTRDRREFRTRQLQCIKIQSVARYFLAAQARKKSNRIERESVVTIQSWIRMIQAKDNFSSLDKTTVKAQAVVRRFLVRKRRRLQHNRGGDLSSPRGVSDQAVLIQSIWRKQLCRRRFESMQEFRRCRDRSACSIQSAWRAAQRQHDFTKASEAALLIQSVWRQHEVCKLLKLHIDEPLCLQSFRRHEAARIHLESDVEGGLDCRSNDQCDRTHERAVASIRIHDQWRAHRDSQIAATRLQAFARQSTEVRRYQKKREALIRMQCFVRKSVAKKAKMSRTRQCTAAETVQRMFRGHAARKIVLALEKQDRLNIAATSIIARWRAKRETDLFNAKVAAIILIQSYLRAFATKTYLSHRAKSCVSIQALVRGSASRKKHASRLCQKTREKINDTPLTITFHFGIEYLDNAATQETQTLGLSYPSRWNPSVYRSTGASKQTDSASTARRLVQRKAKAYLCRLRFLRQKRATSVIQSSWRTFAKKHGHDATPALPSRVPPCVLAMRREDSAFCIQKWWRRNTIVKQLENIPATSEAETTTFDSTVDQSHFSPSYVQTSLAGDLLWQERRAATTIQSFWKTAWEQRRLEELSIRLSNVSLCVIALRCEDSAFRLQKWWRRWRIASPHLVRRHRAAQCLQQVYCSWKAKQAIDRFQTAVRLLERAVFGSLSRSLACYGLLQANTIVAGDRVRRIASDDARRLWSELEAKLQRLAVTLIQAVYRGYRSRVRVDPLSVSPLHCLVGPSVLPPQITTGALRPPTTSTTARLSPTAVANEHVYRDRVEQKALAIVVAYATAEAECVVMRHQAK